MTEAKMSAPSELSEVRQQMRENLNKKNAEAEEAFSPSMSRMAASLTDDDYQDLLERLRVADFLYTEYSLEEVIYQLAKVMFSQSLTRGSSEAQEALQKFTGFLEAETENGRISRSLEKKVLDSGNLESSSSKKILKRVSDEEGLVREFLNKDEL
ncbi:hypothetical protein J6590_059674 [Homalodisca vitripennis]|nr:hypothetical protein J6590_059674 [Homalodisca vitripennis]